MSYFKCKKCGRKFQQKPTEHGLMSVTIYPGKPKPREICDGEIIEISYEEWKNEITRTV